MSPNESRAEQAEAFLVARPLPAPGPSKRDRGEIVVIGGAARSPGAALIAGRAALRVGAGRLTIALAASVAAAAAVSMPESGVVPLAETSAGSIRGRGIAAVARDLGTADAVLVGPGLDDIEETRRLVRRLHSALAPRATLVLDAYVLGAIAGRPRRVAGQAAILTPNSDEAAVLLGGRFTDAAVDTVKIARRYRAVVSCNGWVADQHGRLVLVGDGGPGLGTSGSGDALAGAIAGLAARGCDPLQAAVWGTYLHVAAGRTLAREYAPLGFLASEIVDRFAVEMNAADRTSS
ncbi:NAD(P)H-hydrate dehydratase [Leifsonia poae]|uniref:NAD(P)H-hydrate dehydratase n=1 Tax=Leifsonia poae TaxID=110933 RepID=UPI003D66BA2A